MRVAEIPTARSPREKDIVPRHYLVGHESVNVDFT
jgi:hypothetical protein